MEGSWEGISGCVVHVDVHGECVCCGWMQYSNCCSRRDVLLFMVPKYPFFQPNALLEKADVSTTLHRSIHSMHKTLLCMLCMMKTAELAVETSAFFQ